MNEDQYLLFPEDQTITFKVRIRNTGNIALTNLSYAYAVNGTAISPPPGCSGGGSLATSLAKGAAPSYCTFTLPATAVGGSVNDLNVSIMAQGLASGVPTGDTSGGATVKVVPRPRLAVTLRAAPYRLGDDGDGADGTLSYTYSSPLTLQRQAGSADGTIQRPTGWLYLSVRNTGGATNDFALGVTLNGAPLDLAALGCPTVPGALGAVGGSGTSYTCVFPKDFATTGTFDFAGQRVGDERHRHRIAGLPGHDRGLRGIVARRPQPRRHARPDGGQDEQDREPGPVVVDQRRADRHAHRQPERGDQLRPQADRTRLHLRGPEHQRDHQDTGGPAMSRLLRIPRLHGRGRGQALVEFALVFPVFMLVLFGILDVGRYVYVSNALNEASREGARYGSVDAVEVLLPRERGVAESLHLHLRGHPGSPGRRAGERRCHGDLQEPSARAACSRTCRRRAAAGTTS